MSMQVSQFTITCQRCGHVWAPRKPEVRACPKCRSYWFDTPKSSTGVPGKPEPGQLKPRPKPKREPQSFEQWWPAVKKSPAYAGIDCERELEKMKVWLTTAKGKHRTLNKGFVVNWLNKIDAPVNAGIGEPCTARVRNQDGTRYVPCGKPSIRKQGLGFLCVDCDRDYQERQSRETKP